MNVFVNSFLSFGVILGHYLKENHKQNLQNAYVKYEEYSETKNEAFLRNALIYNALLLPIMKLEYTSQHPQQLTPIIESITLILIGSLRVKARC